MDYKGQLTVFYGMIALFVVLLTVFSISSGVRKEKKLLPPGPRPLPIVGNLLSLGGRAHQALAQLAKQYGSIMTLYFGSVRVVIVSDAGMAKELFSVSDASFASRPIHDLMYTTAKYLNYGGKDGEVSGFTCTYSPRVREVRQLCISELFTTQKLEMSKSIRMEEVLRIMAAFKITGAENEAIDLRPILCEFGCRNSCRMLFNKAFLDLELHPKSEVGLHPEAFIKWEEVMTKLLASKSLADIIPLFRLLDKLDLQGLHARWNYVNTLRLRWTHYVFSWYQKHAPSENAEDPVEESDKDFAETLLRLNKSGKHPEIAINSFLSGLLAAGADTTATTLEWALLELARHPHIMEKLQVEIDAKFGMVRPVEEDEAAQLPYLQAFVKEILRLHPPAVLAIPHCNTEDAMLGGYHIPARTAVIANLWAIHRDPSAWGEDASVFNPDRFLGSDINVNGTNYQFLPFGAGRRICPGRSLAMRALHVAVGSFIHAFEWSALPGIELNVNEGINGINIRPETPTLLRISLRPPATLYLSA
ncbi:hypothetical protein KC19_1G032800 [Ceratodon purpureus]|uniref:Cytochrome P450 n=1 Tax=Ceratodon purpureus TaxID=3225 RepID=A0A8T0J313_CERPU|nr:hypothetical protein KC19_1G032800 [Ceratodon purpureus]KAG0589600.1 hypothetical protein KC19_1G032800 [Ceratodon purpureus]KAG0589601.1 hypothetical protein KC19_1G032800 [Ceratodon purpureus]KAG0589602.1 hypothetical protein KC19_1G032800 [Ceratodon purpureus]